MDIIYWLIPLAILLVGIAVAIFSWAVRNRQFDDLDSPGRRILLDDDERLPESKKQASRSAENSSAEKSSAKNSPAKNSPAENLETGSNTGDSRTDNVPNRNP